MFEGFSIFIKKVLYYLPRPWLIPRVIVRKVFGPKTILRNIAKTWIRYIGSWVSGFSLLRNIVLYALKFFPETRERILMLSKYKPKNIYSLSDRSLEIYRLLSLKQKEK